MTDQTIQSLEQREWLLLRPDTYVGPTTPTDVLLHTPTPTTVRVSPALVHLTNEVTTNAVDNAHRDSMQRYIKIDLADDGSLRVCNDGSTLPIERLPPMANETEGDWAITAAFGRFQTGSNFNDSEERFTAGRNGVGVKSVSVFGTRFTVEVINATAKKVFTQTWRNNMSVVEAPRIKAHQRKTNETSVTWTPDHAKLGNTPEAFPQVVMSLARHASLCAPDHVKVSLNGEALKLNKPEHFARDLGGVTPFASDTIIDANGRVRMRLCVAATEGPPCMYAFVNATPCPEGKHTAHILQKVADILESKARGKRGASGDVKVTPNFVRQHTVIVAVVQVPNPRFTSQTKECLDTPVSQFGWRWEPSDAFRSALERSPLVELALKHGQQKEDAAAAKMLKTGHRTPSIPKYEPAIRCYKPTSTLLLVEGDSAANYARAGIAVVGRKDYGLYPLRGKPLNARGVSNKTLVDNTEANHLLKILDLNPSATYTASSRLPYGRVMILSDQDVDGAHIAGLLCNLLECVAPSLLRARPDYICRFATPLIRATEKGTTHSFFAQSEYDAWVASGRVAASTKYFKGLATSTAAMAKEAFREVRKHTLTLRHTGDACSEAMGMVFDKKRADDRKTFLLACDPKACLDYNKDVASISQFLHDEMLPQYALASVTRAIPSAIDGFKVAQRKVFYGARVLKMVDKSGRGDDTIKVAAATGKIQAATQYHHGDASLSATIVGMACDYAGAGNVNLLMPNGQFGTRHSHEAGAPRYIETALNDPIQHLLYPYADDAVLTHVVDEGKEVEYESYVPVIPSVLCFGAHGVATGWSTDCPMFRPRDVLEATRAWLEGQDLPPLKPWYRGFTGSVLDHGDGTYEVHGKVEKRGDDVHVLEVPPVKETEAYKTEWRKKWTVVSGEGDTDIEVHVILQKCDVTDLKALGLVKKLNFGNVHLLDAQGTLHKYAHPHEIVAAHGEVRLSHYVKRLAHQVAQLRAEVTAADERARFIEACVEGRFDMRAHDTEAAAAEEVRALLMIEGDVSHLLRMPLTSLTKHRAAELRKAALHKRAECEALEKVTPKEAWTADLDALGRVLP